MTIEPLSRHAARERHIQLVHNDKLGLRYNRHTNDTVWHYTNIAGLNGILGSSSLWASDYRYMNDTTELNFGIDIVEMILAHDIEHPDLTRDVLEEILQEIAIIKHSTMNLFVFTCSFCMRGNVLSQWRAYARKDGIAIGFQRSVIEKFANDQGYTAGMIYYYWGNSQKNLPSEISLHNWMQNRVSILLKMLTDLDIAAEKCDQAIIDGDETVPFASTQQRGGIIQKWCAETAAFIKHPAFEEEQEWRCMKVIDDPSIFSSAVLEHRSSGTSIIPYINLKIQSENVKDRGIRQVVIGPNTDMTATMHAVSFLTQKHKLYNLSIAQPFQPLRV